jgi:hypothetical protein
LLDSGIRLSPSNNGNHYEFKHVVEPYDHGDKVHAKVFRSIIAKYAIKET